MIIPFNCDSVKVTSRYGTRTLNGKTENHGGYDMVGIGSTDIVAVEGGTVVQSRIVTDKSNLTWQWGNYVCIKTASGQYHYYCHMASRAVSQGQTVRMGDKLGVMGNTGYSFGAHLHFEVRQSDGKTKVSPETVLGIANVVGTYTRSSLERDLDVLVKKGIINSPMYWKQKAAQVQYLEELIHNVAEALK